jgi:hypothetical protein
VLIHSGRGEGARFWKKKSAVAPLGKRFQSHWAVVHSQQRALGDGEVVRHQVELGEARLGEEEFGRVGDADFFAADVERRGFGRRRHVGVCFVLRKCRGLGFGEAGFRAKR